MLPLGDFYVRPTLVFTVFTATLSRTGLLYPGSLPRGVSDILP